MPVKVLRRYEDMGLIYTTGRSRANYRLLDESAVWCVRVIGGLHALGLTLAEIRELAAVYLGRPDEPIGPHLARRLGAVRARLDARIAELQELRRRVREFEAHHQAELSGQGAADFGDRDPTRTPAASRAGSAARRA